MKSFFNIIKWALSLIFFFWVMSVLFKMCIGDSEEEKLEKKRIEYQKACEKQDFDNARNIVLKIDTTESGSLEYYREKRINALKEGLKYVNDKEIYTLLSKPTQDNNNRIMYLYNSYKTDELPDMEDVVEVSLSNGNDVLGEKLIRSGVGVNEKIAKVVLQGDNEALMETILNRAPDLLDNGEISNLYMMKKGEEKYKEMLRRSLSSQLQNIYNFELPQKLATGIIDYSDHWDYERYNREITPLNQLCYKLIVKAVDAGDKELALKVLSLMKTSYSITELNGHKYKVTESFEDINEAKRIINK